MNAFMSAKRIALVVLEEVESLCFSTWNVFLILDWRKQFLEDDGLIFRTYFERVVAFEFV